MEGLSQPAKHRFSRLNEILLVAALVLTTGPSVWSHVVLDEPSGGQQFVVGDTVIIHWHDMIPHDKLNYDLHYSTNGFDGPWIPIALDLPVAGQYIYEEREYTWVLPDVTTVNAIVRVTQDNETVDYYGYSDSTFSIVPTDFACCLQSRGNVDGDSQDRIAITDITFLTSYLFGNGPQPACSYEADIDRSGSTNVVDLTFLTSYLFSDGPAPPDCW